MPSFVKSAIGFIAPKAARNADTSKKLRIPSPVRSPGQGAPAWTPGQNPPVSENDPPVSALLASGCPTVPERSNDPPDESEVPPASIVYQVISNEPPDGPASETEFNELQMLTATAIFRTDTNDDLFARFTVWILLLVGVEYTTEKDLNNGNSENGIRISSTENAVFASFKGIQH